MSSTLTAPHAASPVLTAVPVAITRGDGIGPEIMSATLRVLEAAGARIAPTEVRMGETVYLGGHTSGLAPDA